MANQDAEFVNVVFDPTFSSFDQDLDNINLDNMMNISYSEEVLQKNFTTLINLLKSLHKGMLQMGSQLVDSKEWIEKLKEITNPSILETKLSDLQKLNDEKFNQINSDMNSLKERVDNHDKVLDQHQQEIDKLKELQRELDEKLEKFKNDQEKFNQEMRNQIEIFRDKIAQNDGLKELIDQIRNAQREQDGRLTNMEKDNENLKISIDERIKEGANSSDLDELREQLKKLQNQIDQYQSQINILQASSGGGDGDNISQNQMQVILQEINKLRQQIENNVNHLFNSNYQQPTQSDIDKLNMKFKGVNDEIEKLRHEMQSKLEKKFDQSEAKKMINEINMIKDILNQLQKQSGVQFEPTPVQEVVQQVGMDPNFMNEFKELQQQVNQLENELKNHKMNYNQHLNNNNKILSEIEKKLAGLQLDRVLTELQAVRDNMDQLRKDTDSNKQKIKDVKKTIENFITKEDAAQLIGQSIQQLRDELMDLLNKLESDLDKKADKADLKQLETNLYSKLEEVVAALIKQLANKQESKKALVYLESKINQIFLMLDGEGNQKDGDGCFAKKQLWSCASCDKDLDKYKGNLGDYKNWAVFPPKETSPERMGKFGVGYKTMQEKVRHTREKLEKEKNMMERSQQKSQGGFRPSTTGQQIMQVGNVNSHNDHLPKVNK